MKSDILKKPLFYFNDSRVTYSVEQLESLLSSGVVEPAATVHSVCLPFQIEDVIERVAPMLNGLLLSESPNEANSDAVF